MDDSDDAAPATALANVTTRKRRRRRSSGDGDDVLLDAMLHELGIPTSDSKKKQKPRENPSEGNVVELITPPRPPRRAPPAFDAASGEETKTEETYGSGGLADDSILDLTTPTPPSSGKRHRRRSPPRNARQSIVDLLSPNSSEATESDDLEQEGDSGGGIPTPAREKETQRNLLTMLSDEDGDNADGDDDSEDERILREITETQTRIQRPNPSAKSSVTRIEYTETLAQRLQARMPQRRQPSGDDEPSLPPPKRRERQQKKQAAPKPAKEIVVAAVAMEKRLSDSPVGAAIATALEGNTYNNKPVPFVMERPFASDLHVVQWERRGDGRSGGEDDSSRFVIAMHYPAESLLDLLADHGYDALVGAVKWLEEEPLHVGGRKKTVAWGSMVLIVEGMDRALIARSKKSKTRSKTPAQPNAAPPFTATFSDLHELAFRLFMDTSVHTKFTCDMEATASYAALLTREIIVAAVKQTSQEEFLESVPRIHSFRVLPGSGSTLNPFANTWLRMLQMIPSVSEDRAQSLLDHFPTFQSLLRAYNDPFRSVEEKEELLADKLNGTRLESALSRRIFRVFSGWSESGTL